MRRGVRVRLEAFGTDVFGPWLREVWPGQGSPEDRAPGRGAPAMKRVEKGNRTNGVVFSCVRSTRCTCRVLPEASKHLRTMLARQARQRQMEDAARRPLFGSRVGGHGRAWWLAQPDCSVRFLEQIWMQAEVHAFLCPVHR